MRYSIYMWHRVVYDNEDIFTTENNFQIYSKIYNLPLPSGASADTRFSPRSPIEV